MKILNKIKIEKNSDKNSKLKKLKNKNVSKSIISIDLTSPKKEIKKEIFSENQLKLLNVKIENISIFSEISQKNKIENISEKHSKLLNIKIEEKNPLKFNNLQNKQNEFSEIFSKLLNVKIEIGNIPKSIKRSVTKSEKKLKLFSKKKEKNVLKETSKTKKNVVKQSPKIKKKAPIKTVKKSTNSKKTKKSVTPKAVKKGVILKLENSAKYIISECEARQILKEMNRRRNELSLCTVKLCNISKKYDINKIEELFPNLINICMIKDKISQGICLLRFASSFEANEATIKINNLELNKNKLIAEILKNIEEMTEIDLINYKKIILTPFKKETFFEEIREIFSREIVITQSNDGTYSLTFKDAEQALNIFNQDTFSINDCKFYSNFDYGDQSKKVVRKIKSESRCIDIKKDTFDGVEIVDLEDDRDCEIVEQDEDLKMKVEQILDDLDYLLNT